MTAEKPRYEKPVSRALTGLSVAEGVCIDGNKVGALSGCVVGPAADVCYTGAVDGFNPDYQCNPGDGMIHCIDGLKATGQPLS